MIKKEFSAKVEEITIKGRLFLPDLAAPHPIVCICHGIPAGSVPDPNDGGYPALAEQIGGHGPAVLIFNFRGTGMSGGNLDLLGWTRDLAAVIDYVDALPEVDSSHMALLGFSGGAAVSIHVAARDHRIACVAACACPSDFSRLSSAADPDFYVDHYRKIGAIRDADFPRSTREWLNGFRQVRPIDCVDRITPRPLLFIHSKDDETVPISQAHRLYEKAKDPKELVVLDGAGHKLRRDNRVTDAFLSWLKPLMPLNRFQ